MKLMVESGISSLLARHAPTHTNTQWLPKCSSNNTKKKWLNERRMVNRSKIHCSARPIIPQLTLQLSHTPLRINTRHQMMRSTDMYISHNKPLIKQNKNTLIYWINCVTGWMSLICMCILRWNADECSHDSSPCVLWCARRASHTRYVCNDN